MSRKIRSFRADAVVLKHRDQGEADRMLTLYSRQRGKVRALAKGVRKTRSRKAGHLEPFTRVSLQLATGRYWFVISQAEAQETFNNLRESLETIGFASYLIELIDKFTYEEEENSGIFHLLVKTLRRLNQGDSPNVVIRYFEIRLLDTLGFRPELKHCVVSGEEITAQDQYFSASLGGVIAPAHGITLSGATPISMAALKYLRHFQRSSYQDATRAKIPPETQRELEVLMHYYITYLLERGLNTPAFMRRVKKLGATDLSRESAKDTKVDSSENE
jgi:DNA repair protein RecO (recombination protein O)